jgi:hypothetical protein
MSIDRAKEARRAQREGGDTAVSAAAARSAAKTAPPAVATASAREGARGVPPPAAEAGGAPLPSSKGHAKAHAGSAAATEEKLVSGREVRPGQNALGAQGVHAPGLPAVPLAQPAQPVLRTLPPTASEKERGAGHARSPHCAKEEGGAVVCGCEPAGHTKTPARHCEAAVAPRAAVDSPLGHASHAELEAPPAPDKNVPRSHSVGTEAPAAAT